MARRDGGYLRPAVDAELRAQIGDEHGRRTGQRGCALPSALRLRGSAAVGAGGGAVRHPALFRHRLAVAGRDGCAAVRCRRGDDACGGGAVPAAGHQCSAVAANDPHRNDRSYRWTRNPMYLGMGLIYAGLAIGFDGPIAFALLPLVLIAIQTQVIAREERYLEAKFGDDYRRYKAKVRRWL